MNNVRHFTFWCVWLAIKHKVATLRFWQKILNSPHTEAAFYYTSKTLHIGNECLDLLWL